jgi:hypothetical protein
VSVALGLLDLERGLDVGARQVLLPHERRDKVSVLLARQRAEHSHERELVVEVDRGPHLGGVVVAVDDVSALRAGEVGEDVTGRLLLAVLKLVELAPRAPHRPARHGCHTVRVKNGTARTGWSRVLNRGRSRPAPVHGRYGPYSYLICT